MDTPGPEISIHDVDPELWTADKGSGMIRTCPALLGHVAGIFWRTDGTPRRTFPLTDVNENKISPKHRTTTSRNTQYNGTRLEYWT